MPQDGLTPWGTPLSWRSPALLNLSLRLGSAEAAILPWGLWRSLLTTALLAVTGWPGGELAYRPMIGVTGHDGDEAAREHRGGSHRHAA